MTAVYRVEVSGPRPRTADELALMLTSSDHYQTSDYVITVWAEQKDCPECGGTGECQCDQCQERGDLTSGQTWACLSCYVDEEET